MNPGRPRVPRLIPPQSGGVCGGRGFATRLRWTYRAKGFTPESESFELSLCIDRADYERACGELAFAPFSPDDYPGFVLLGPMDDVRRMATELRALSEKRCFSPLQEVENVVQMVRSLRYWNDPDHPHAVDQPKYPVQTLVDGGGDCEDFAILAASLLCSLGHSAALLYIETEATAHMALGLNTDRLEDGFAVHGPDGRRYVYIETAPTSVELGVVPNEFLGGLRQMVAIPLPMETCDAGDES